MSRAKSSSPAVVTRNRPCWCLTAAADLPPDPVLMHLLRIEPILPTRPVCLSTCVTTHFHTLGCCSLPQGDARHGSACRRPVCAGWNPTPTHCTRTSSPAAQRLAPYCHWWCLLVSCNSSIQAAARWVVVLVLLLLVVMVAVVGSGGGAMVDSVLPHGGEVWGCGWRARIQCSSAGNAAEKLQLCYLCVCWECACAPQCRLRRATKVWNKTLDAQRGSLLQQGAAVQHAASSTRPPLVAATLGRPHSGSRAAGPAAAGPSRPGRAGRCSAAPAAGANSTNSRRCWQRARRPAGALCAQRCGRPQPGARHVWAAREVLGCSTAAAGLRGAGAASHWIALASRRDRPLDAVHPRVASLPPLPRRH